MDTTPSHHRAALCPLSPARMGSGSARECAAPLEPKLGVTILSQMWAGKRPMFEPPTASQKPPFIRIILGVYWHLCRTQAVVLSPTHQASQAEQFPQWIPPAPSTMLPVRCTRPPEHSPPYRMAQILFPLSTTTTARSPAAYRSRAAACRRPPAQIRSTSATSWTLATILRTLAAFR